MKLYKLIFIIGLFTLAIACSDSEEAVKRSNTLNIYGPTEVFIGDENTFEAPLFTLNDSRTWNWNATGAGPSASTGEGEFFDVSFNELGTSTVTLSEGGREGSIEVEAISKEVSLDGYDEYEAEEADVKTVGIPILIDNFVVGETTIVYTVSGSAVEGVDYELVSSNPLVLTSDSEEEEYFIYFDLPEDVTPEAFAKEIIVTLTSVTSEIENEVVLSDSVELLAGKITIEDDLKEVAIKNIVDETVSAPGIVAFEITLSSESSVNVDVNYTITGTGVSDATPDGPNSVTFSPGETSKLIYVQFNSSAFNSPQSVTITLNSLSPADAEASIDTSRKVKKFIIE